MAQHISKSKLHSLGFVQQGDKFVLQHKHYDTKLRRNVTRIAGWIQLGAHGLVLKHQGLPVSVDGKVQLYQRF